MNLKLSIKLLVLILLPLLIWLLLRAFGFVKLSKNSQFTAKSAKSGNRTSRLAEAIILLCVGGLILVFIATNSSTGGMLLRLDELRPAFAATNIAVAVCAGICLLLSVLVCLFWRSSVGVIFAAVVLCGYGWVLNGPGNLIWKIAPEKSFEPTVDYTFKIDGIPGVDLWVNGVYLGKTPVKITGKQFHQKIPFLAEPPGGYSKQFKGLPKKPWFRFTMACLEKEERGYGRPYYRSEGKDYYIKAKFKDELPESVVGGSGGGSRGLYSYEYEVSLLARFPSVTKFRSENTKRFEDLIRKAMLCDYHVEPQWFEAALTYSRRHFEKLRELSKKEDGLIEIIKTLDQKQGLHKKQDIDRIVRKDARKKKMSLADYLFYGNLESAVKIGGPDVEKYLLRQYQRDRRLQGNDIPYNNRKRIMGTNLNKAFYWLCYLDSEAGQNFRKKHRNEVMKFAELLTNTGFNHDRKPPEFLFFDLEQGKKSLAYEYWPKYFYSVEDSQPGWEPDKLKKRWAYLAKMKQAATFEMYMNCWDKVRDISKLMGGQNLVEAVETVPQDRRRKIVQAIIEDLEQRHEKKKQELGLEQQYSFFEEDEYISCLRKYLAESGDAQSLQWWVSRLKPAPNNHDPERLAQIFRSEKGLNHPLIKILAEHKDPDLRKMPLKAIRAYPTPTNRKILQVLLEDEDAQVRSVAEEVTSELDALAEMPLEKLDNRR
ncbi:MAG: HEAT repeat domain-containing protein [Planctomycetota bacterium]|jgi:hypothetical protein